MSNQQELERIQWVKINYFCSKLGINDISRAEKYLNKANWDEILAVRNFNLSHPDYIPNIHNIIIKFIKLPFILIKCNFHIIKISHIKCHKYLKCLKYLKVIIEK